MLSRSLMISVFISALLSMLIDNSAWAEECEPFSRPPAKVGATVYYQGWSNGTIAAIFENGKIKVDYTFSSQLYDEADLGYRVSCLGGLRLNNAVYQRTRSGNLNWIGTVDHLYDNGYVDAGRPGKGRVHSVVRIESIVMPLDVDPETGIKNGQRGLYNDQEALIVQVFVGGKALVKTNCGHFFCSDVEISTKAFVKAR